MKRTHILKSVKFGLVALFFMLFVRDFAHAQRGRISIDDRVKNLTEQLSLSKDQADSVRRIYEASEKERSAAFEAHRGDRSAMREYMAKIMKGADDKIDSLLTDEQKTKYDKIKKDRPSMMRPAPPSGRTREQAPGKPDKPSDSN